jgi:hypothetical protein
VRYPLVQRGLIALVLVLAMTVWFSASAVVPALVGQWHLSAGAAAWMTAPVQAGFVLGAVGSAALGLADRIRPHLLVAGCAAGAAACTRGWLLAFTAVWGAAVIADSGVFSTLLSELADRRYLGTALTTQTAIGFGLTIVTIQAIPLAAAVTGWRYAFLALAAGPMTALPALTALSRQMRPNDLPSPTTERTSP